MNIATNVTHSSNTNFNTALKHLLHFVCAVLPPVNNL